MKRILEYMVSDREEGWTVKRFLKARGFSSQNLVQLKKDPGAILVNGQPAYVIHPVHSGDSLRILILEERSSDKIPAVPLPLSVVYEDEDLMVIDKPAGMPIHPSMNNYDNSLANALAWYFEQKGEAFVFRCINRLDRDTTGLTLIAKHMVSAGILSGMAMRREIGREYLAIAEGTGLPAQGCIDTPLGRKPGSAIERMVDPEHGERAVTHYRVLEERNGCTLLSLRLETGRTHQIRVHMKSIGHPLIGDFLYNPGSGRMKRQALHSGRLSFSHPVTGEPLTFTSPMPADMRRAWEG